MPHGNIENYVTEAKSASNLVNRTEMEIKHAYSSAILALPKDSTGGISLDALLGDVDTHRTTFNDAFLASLDPFIKTRAGITGDYANDFQRDAFYQAAVGFNPASLTRLLSDTNGRGVLDEREFLNLVGRGISNAWGEHTDRGYFNVTKELTEGPKAILTATDADQILPYLTSTNAGNAYLDGKLKLDMLRDRPSMIAGLIDENTSSGGMVRPEYAKIQPYYDKW